MNASVAANQTSVQGVTDKPGLGSVVPEHLRHILTSQVLMLFKVCLTFSRLGQKGSVLQCA